jgi:hypothetical protein
MSTSEQIQSALKGSEEAKALAAEHDVHTLMGKLKEWYERVHGLIAADIHDWHWHATTLKNSLNDPKGEPDAADAPTPADGAGSPPEQTAAVESSDAPAAAPLDAPHDTATASPASEPVDEVPHTSAEGV